MTDLDAGVTLTPGENAFFDSKGETPPPEPAKTSDAPEGEKSGEVKDKISGKEPEGEKAEKVVPLAALHEERRERQARDRTIAEMSERLARYDERFKIVEERNKPQAPNATEDPFGYLNTVPTELDGLKKELDGFKQEKHANDQRQQVLNLYSSDVQRFKNGDGKDFSDAYKFLIDGRLAELQAMGHPNPQAGLHDDEFAIVLHALQSQRSPAETLYAVAKARGYVAKADGDGKGDAAKKLDTIERGQAANKSLSSAGGQSGGEDMTAQALLDMPLDEYTKWVDKNPAKAKRLMGG